MTLRCPRAAHGHHYHRSTSRALRLRPLQAAQPGVHTTVMEPPAAVSHAQAAAVLTAAAERASDSSDGGASEGPSYVVRRFCLDTDAEQVVDICKNVCELSRLREVGRGEGGHRQVAHVWRTGGRQQWGRLWLGPMVTTGREGVRTSYK